LVLRGLAWGIPAGVGVAALVWRSLPRDPPALDVRSIPAPLRTSRTAPPREIRVCVTPGPVKSVRVKAGRGAVWRALDSGRVLHLSADEEDRRVTLATSGVQVGDRVLAARRVEIVPASSPGVWIDDHHYRGTVRLLAQPDGQLLAVNVIRLEDYVASVVDSEMPAAFPVDARRAQAVVARTFALARQDRVGPDAEFDVYATERSQRYLGAEYRDRTGRRLAGESASSRQAASDTAGIVLTCDGKVFTSYYSACCGGRTTVGTELFPDAAACHRSVPCDYCQECERYRWDARISAGDFRIAVNDLDRGRLGPIRRVRMLTPVGNGALPRIEVRDDARTVEVTGQDLRQTLPARKLFSPHVSVALSDGEILIEGRGHGHGVGFCQWGARGQALAGRDWRQIVRHYFPGAELRKLNP
jgi:stage II sporulation protein D